MYCRSTVNSTDIPTEGRTFNYRRGKFSQLRESAMDRLYPVHGVILDAEAVLDLPRLFGRQAPKVLEIGSGMGDSTAAQAAADPDRDYLAVEVHPPGVADLLLLIEQHDLTNLRIFDGDVMRLLHGGLAPESVDVIQVFFPDPWPKKRHHKRRLIRPDRVAALRSLLKPDGLLHCATDWAEYAESMLEVLEADSGMVNRHRGFAPRPEHRPSTKFERRGVAAGRRIFDLEFHKTVD